MNFLVASYSSVFTWFFNKTAITTDFFRLNANDWLYLFILASICTAYAFIAAVYIMKFISPFSVVLTYNLEPVYGIVLAILIFGQKEIMSSNFYYGALLIFANGNSKWIS